MFTVMCQHIAWNVNIFIKFQHQKRSIDEKDRTKDRLWCGVSVTIGIAKVCADRNNIYFERLKAIDTTYVCIHPVVN